MQDDDLKYLAAHSSMKVTEIACKSMLEGGSLWRKLAVNGLFDKANNSCLEEFFFAALASPNVDTAREFMSQAFANKGTHQLNFFFYTKSIAFESAKALSKSDSDLSLKMENLPVVLDVLEQLGVDLSVRKGIELSDHLTAVTNGLHHVIDLIDSRQDQDQGKLIEVACVYLDRGIPIHESAEGVGNSPLADLLTKQAGKEPDVLATWAEALISRGHIQEAHLRAVEGVESIDPQALALFEACLARHSIMAISRAAQTLRA